jgi:hypothetical protein
MLLLAEMKAPGDALLEFIIQPQGEGRTVLEVVARFLPRGIAGLAYWYALLPTHKWLFEGMLRSIAQNTGKRVLAGPEKFEAADHTTCKL